MHRLERAKVLLQVARQTLVLRGLERGLRANFAVVRRHALGVDAVGVQVPPVHRDVAVAGDELEQRLADGHVVGGRVVVQLLVPLLHHATLAVVRLLHGENFVANALADVALAAATDRGHRQTHDVAHGRVVLVKRGELRGALELRGGNLARLDVVVVVPHQLAQRHETEPRRHRHQASLTLRAAPGDEIGGDVIAVHQRTRRALLRVANVVNGAARDPVRRPRRADGTLRHANVVVVPIFAHHHGWLLRHLLRHEDEPPAAGALLLRLARALSLLLPAARLLLPPLHERANVRVAARLVRVHHEVLSVILHPVRLIRGANDEDDAVLAHGRLDGARGPSRRAEDGLHLRLPRRPARAPRVGGHGHPSLRGLLPSPAGSDCVAQCSTVSWSERSITIV